MISTRFASPFLAALIAACSSNEPHDSSSAVAGDSSVHGDGAAAGADTTSGGGSGLGGSTAIGGSSGAPGVLAPDGSAGVADSSGFGGNIGSTGDTPEGGSSAVDGQAGALLRGINLSSAEWGPLPGVYGKDYTYPTHSEIDRYAGLKMNALRIPFDWERMQRSLGGSLDETELGRLDDIVNYAAGKGTWIVVDLHNYARYNTSIIGAGTVSSADLADFWSKLAAHYANNPKVVFGLMNEPHDIAVNTWLEAANTSIAAIRAVHATNLILVPGTNWTGAGGWSSANTAMIGVVDSGNNFAYEVHLYLDSDSSGTHTTCVGPTIGTERLTDFAKWLETNHKRAFLGEFGAGLVSNTKVQDQTCATALDSMLTLIESRPDLWWGWTYWAGGPWWQDGFSFSIADSATPWQLTLLQSHL